MDDDVLMPDNTMITLNLSVNVQAGEGADKIEEVLRAAAVGIRNTTDDPTVEVSLWDNLGMTEEF